MQEIKLLILLILTICTYAKYKKANYSNRQGKKEEIKEQNLPNEEVVVKIEETQPERVVIERKDKPFFIADHAIEKFIKIESNLFTSQKPRAQNPHFSEVIKKSNDFNDIFGGEYQKCKDGKIYQMDQDTVLFNSAILHKKSPFNKMSFNRGQYASNQQLFENIREVIQKQTLYIDEPIDRVQNLKEKELSVFQNFAFNLTNLNEDFKMEQQIKDLPSEDQSQPAIKTKLKKKKILKFTKKHLKPIVQLKKAVENEQKKVTKSKQRLVRPSKSTKLAHKRFIDLEQQIKKKQLQLCILKKLYSQNDI